MTSSASSPSLTSPRAASVAIEGDHLRVALQDQREITVPLAWFDWLERASLEQRDDFTIIGDGQGIWWNELDDGVSVPGLLGLPERSEP